MQYNPSNPQQPTIAAIATAVGQGGVGVVRLSGRDAYRIGCLITKKQQLEPRKAYFAKFWGEKTLIDEGLVLYFKAPHSFTGEDVVELQGHGGVVLLNMLLARCFELGARQATAGEFSLRAFENDKMDLVQAEAISDAISATSVAQASSAIRSLSGDFSNKINDLVESLTLIRLYVEASIDFPDEEDVTFLSDGVIESKINDSMAKLEDILHTATQGSLLRDGVCITIAGRPNAGKSSLLNRLSGTQRAIVTDIAGTTRDVLEETLVMGGLTVHLTDTAGLRHTDDKVEQIGIERAKQAVHGADVILLVVDASDGDAYRTVQSLLDDEFAHLERHDVLKKLMIVANKQDLLPPNQQIDSSLWEKSGLPVPIYVSCETSFGVGELIDEIKQKVGFHPPENSFIARTRHIDALNRAYGHLADAKEQLTVFFAGELVAESLRLSAQSLGEITGQLSSDELLGKIFSSFCIGK